MESSDHLPNAGSTELPPLDSASQPKNLQNIEANAGFRLLSGKDSDVAVPALSTMSHSSSLTSQADPVNALTVASAASSDLAFQVPSLSSDSVLAQIKDRDAPGSETVQSSEADIMLPPPPNCPPVLDNGNSHGEEMVVDESQERIPDEDGDVDSELSDGEDIRVCQTRNSIPFSITYLNRLISRQLSKI